MMCPWFCSLVSALLRMIQGPETGIWENSLRSVVDLGIQPVDSQESDDCSQ